MAITCSIDLDTATLRCEISNIYGRVAAELSGEFHFQRGPRYAAEFLGYDVEELAPFRPIAQLPLRESGTPLPSDRFTGARRSLTLAVGRAWTCCWPRAASDRKDAPSEST